MLKITDKIVFICQNYNANNVYVKDQRSVKEM